MRRRFKFIAATLLVIVALTALVFFGGVTPFTPPAPTTWHEVHVGMSRSNILTLAGTSQTGMYPEKIVETWVREGILGRRILEVWYQNTPANDNATIVREYIYWRTTGRSIHTRREP